MSWHRGTTATLQKVEPILEICGKLGRSARTTLRSRIVVA